MLSFDFKAHALAVVSLFAGTCTPPATPTGDPVQADEASYGDPMHAGGHAYSEVASELTGHDGRTLGLRLYVPDEAGHYPVVILSHGFLLNSGLYASYGEHLASWGYVAVLVDYPKNLFNLPSHRDLKNYVINIIDWIETSPRPLQGRADSDRIALVGHSLGGKVSIYTATEDPRVDAVFGIDAVDELLVHVALLGGKRQNLLEALLERALRALHQQRRGDLQQFGHGSGLQCRCSAGHCPSA